MDIIEQAKQHWQKIRDDKDLPERGALDPMDIPHLLEYSCLIDVLQDGEDYQYKIIGAAIQDISRAGQTGKKISEIDSQQRPSRIYDLFRTAYDYKVPQYCELTYIGDDIFVEKISIGVFPLGPRHDTLLHNKDPHQSVTKVHHLWSVVQPTLKELIQIDPTQKEPTFIEPTIK